VPKNLCNLTKFHYFPTGDSVVAEVQLISLFTSHFPFDILRYSAFDIPLFRPYKDKAPADLSRIYYHYYNPVLTSPSAYCIPSTKENYYWSCLASFHRIHLITYLCLGTLSAVLEVGRPRLFEITRFYSSWRVMQTVGVTR
jgi:hypothetical protein